MFDTSPELLSPGEECRGTAESSLEQGNAETGVRQRDAPSSDSKSYQIL